jgi:hypothetical protein
MAWVMARSSTAVGTAVVRLLRTVGAFLTQRVHRAQWLRIHECTNAVELLLRVIKKSVLAPKRSIEARYDVWRRVCHNQVFR